MNIALVGNPNCGKSTLFNALTDGHAKTGNWHGVTVGAATRSADLGGRRAEVTDLPGIYSFSAYSLEEKAAARALDEGNFDLAVCVADALTLPRSLALAGEVRGRFPRAVLVVTMRDLLEKRGGRLDERALAARLGMPVLCISAHKKRELRRLKAFLAAELRAPQTANANTPRFSNGARRSDAAAPHSYSHTPPTARINTTDTPQTADASAPHSPAAARRGKNAAPNADLLAGIYSAGTRTESRAEKLIYNRYFAFPLFLFALLATFFLAFGNHMPGVLLKDGLEWLLAEKLGGFWADKTAATGAAAAAEFVRSVCGGVGSVLSFVPQIAILYFSLFLMEESGFLSALAFMTDGLFRRVGLTGRAAFSVLMGFGCTAAAILTTRGLENKRLQKRVILILCYISCSAKMPVYLAVAASFFRHPFFVLVCIYFVGVLLSLTAAFVAAKLYRGDEEFVMEIAHLQIPSLRLALKSLLFSLKQFIIKVATVVAAFLIASWVLLSFSFSFEYVGAESGKGILAVLCRGLKYLFYPMGIAQWQVALAAVSGLIAKENVAGMLALFYGADLTAAMSAPSAAAFIFFIMTCSPCVSAIAATAREAGAKCAFAFAAAQTGTAFLGSYILYALLSRGAMAAALIALLAAVLIAGAALRRILYAKICRRRGAKTQRFHRRALPARLVRLFAPFTRPRHPRERRADAGKRDAFRRRRDRLLHDRGGRGKTLLPRSVRRRKRADRR